MTRQPMLSGLLALLTACGAASPAPAPAPASPPPPAAEPSPAPAVEAPATAEPAPASETATASPPPTEASSPAADSSAPVRTQAPIDVLTARDAAFQVDYANSDHKRASETRCEKESKDDLEKRAACLTKSRDQFLADVLRFRKDAAGQVSLLVYKRNGSQLAEISVGAVQLSEEGSDGVKLKFKAQKGTRPLWRSKTEANIRVPNGYSIEFDDPDLGHLHYDAKVGLVSN